jgi:hypothetical protein
MAIPCNVPLVVVALALAGVPMLVSREASARELRMGSVAARSIVPHRAPMSHPIRDFALTASNQKAGKVLGVGTTRAVHRARR